jgi:hypothetical protein
MKGINIYIQNQVEDILNDYDENIRQSRVYMENSEVNISDIITILDSYIFKFNNNYIKSSYTTFNVENEEFEITSSINGEEIYIGLNQLRHIKFIKEVN